MFHNLVQERVNQLQIQLKTIDDKLAGYPDGEFRCRLNGSNTKWFVRQGNETVYLPKNQRTKAEIYAVKQHLMSRRNDILAELQILSQYLISIPVIQSSEKMLLDPRYHELLSPFFQSNDSYLKAWQEESFESNPYHPEKRIHKTPLGYSVRSKSELFISLALMQHQIPHRYECALDLASGTIYPDFTLLHPDTHRLIYWEHLGMMDDSTYSQDANRKIQRYISNGISPGINLILTSETQDHPLDVDHINRTIQMYI